MKKYIKIIAAIVLCALIVGITFYYYVDKNKSEIKGIKNPISPNEYVKMLNVGLDVDWAKTEKGLENYNTKSVIDFKEKGISHVRIRIKEDATEEFLKSLDYKIKDCLDNGLIPVIAYQGDELKNNPTDENIDKVVNWWGRVSNRYKEYSSLLSFDILIEVTDALNKEPEKLNEIYEKVVKEIRKTNPNRILMISPRLRSDPMYLKELKIPSESNGYLIAEWHFYAAGPSKTNEKKKWTVGTEDEKKLIKDKINEAIKWQDKNNIKTWVGAWMPGNYNDENDFTIEEQVQFAKFMSGELKKAGIPFAVNSDTKFYDRENNKWIEDMMPVLEAILN